MLDEADRMADMGFMPQVQKILYTIRAEHQTMLFSATLDGAIKRLVDRYMHDPVYHEVGPDEPTVDEMEHRFLFVHDLDRVKVVAAIAARRRAHARVLQHQARRPTVSCTSLRREGVGPPRSTATSARPRASGRWPSSRRARCPVLVATDVAARGIHVDGVDVVVHYDPADDDKTYLHRSGRTARAGESGVAVTLMLWNQENIVRTVQRRLGLCSMPIVEVFSNDPRLADLKSWEPAAEAVVA